MASTQYNGQFVKMYIGVPFDAGYTHCLYGSINEKIAWYDSNCDPHQYDNLMHIKLDTTSGRGTIRLEVPDNLAHKFNYCLIHSKNPDYFCFVMGCRYINDGKTAESSVYEFDIEKDVMASCFRAKTDLVECAIDRHHSSASGFNNPWIPEPYGGTALNQDYTDLGFDTAECYGVIQYYDAVPNADDKPGRINDAGTFVSWVPSGCKLGFFQIGDVSAIHNFTVNDAKMGECVAAIYTAPKCLFGVSPAEGGAYLDDDCLIRAPRTTAVYPYDSVPSTVENNKCYYYPYNFYRVYNDAGQTMDLKYELWDEDSRYDSKTLSLALEGCATPPVEVTLFPVGYCKASTGTTQTHGRTTNVQISTHKLKLDGYPHGSWVNDAYAATIGRNSYDRVWERTAMDAVKAGSTLNPVKMFNGTMSSLFGTAEEVMNSYWEPDTLSGSEGSGGAEYVAGHKRFYGSHMALSDDDFKKLDSLFTRYGYAQGGLVARPDPEARDRWTYIKTIGDPFVSTAGCISNASEVARVNAVFRKGVTFWRTVNSLNDIGTYNKSNGTDSMPLP